MLILAAAYDWQRRRIPDWLTLAGAVAALAGAAWEGRAPLGAAIMGGLIALVLFGPLYLLGLGWSRARGQSAPALGFGDVKLALLVGVVCRWPAALPALLIGVLAGGLAALALLLWHLARNTYRQDIALPYGVFLTLGGLAGLWADGLLLQLP
ncbi:MAG: A24 family peptidase [Caldilineales bacterium]|nr:A24 family peptidase [Caldilineales bacterium]MDW8316679.1 A24 family peptidase [Anaerolineae bacterium]